MRRYRIWWCWLLNWLWTSLENQEVWLRSVHPGFRLHVCCSKKNERLEKIGWSWNWASVQTSTLFKWEQAPLAMLCGLLFALQPVSSAVDNIPHHHTPLPFSRPYTWSCCTVHERSSVHTNIEFNLDAFMGHQSACKWLPDSVHFCADMWTRLCHVTTVKAWKPFCTDVLWLTCCFTAS